MLAYENRMPDVSLPNIFNTANVRRTQIANLNAG